MALNSLGNFKWLQTSPVKNEIKADEPDEQNPSEDQPSESIQYSSEGLSELKKISI